MNRPEQTTDTFIKQVNDTADKFTVENLKTPSAEDYILIRSAFMAGAVLGIQHELELSLDATGFDTKCIMDAIKRGGNQS